MPRQTRLTPPPQKTAQPQARTLPEPLPQAREPLCDVGVLGLGALGRNYALNITEHGYRVAGCDADLVKVEAFWKESEGLAAYATDNIRDFLAALKQPRTIFIITQAGPSVDNCLTEILPHLRPDDVVVDGSNSHFEDTDARVTVVAESGALYLGMGMSGGEQGARHGASLMLGGVKDGYRHIHDILEATAARANGDACHAFLGPGSSGHFVKMIHGGIECALMQLIAEAYDMMKRGLDLSDDELSAVFQQWDSEELNCHLLEITARLFRDQTEQSGRQTLNEPPDEMREKGTGRWMSQDAMDLHVPTPTIDAAVAMRGRHASRNHHEQAAEIFSRPDRTYQGDRGVFLDQLRNGLYAAMIISHAQAMTHLRKASEVYEYGLDLEEVARIWRAGSTIRSGIVTKMRTAFHARMDLPSLLCDPGLGGDVAARHEDLRAVVRTALDLLIPVPALAASVAYFDAFHDQWSPANLIQALNDDVSAHAHDRMDEKGTYHARWIGV